VWADYRRDGEAGTEVIRGSLALTSMRAYHNTQGEKGVQMPAKSDTKAIVRDIKRRTRKKYTAEEKIRIVLEGLRGEESIASICRREGISPNLYYRWSKEFLEAGKKHWKATTLFDEFVELL
jgi:hypothetical protein